MKIFLTTNLLLCTLIFRVTFAKEVAYILEVKKETPLFKRPSMKSEKIAVAEAGTNLLYIEKSQKGIWVKLRDSDGVEGWMPVSRTDYNEVASEKSTTDKINEIAKLEKEEAQKESKNPDEREKSKEEMMKDIMDQRKKQLDPGFRIAPLMRWTNKKEPATTRIGIRADLNLVKIALTGNGRFGQAWAAAEGTVPAPQGSHRESSDYTFAARYVLRAPLYGPLVYGPDIGYAADNVKNDFRSHLSLGLASAVLVGPFDFGLRGGYDFFNNSRYSIEVQLGASF